MNTFSAFFTHFLRRCFGYWDTSWWGAISFVSFVLLILTCLKHKLERSSLILLIGAVGCIIIKSILFAHPYGVHAGIMPAGTQFPTLFFFNYYYNYIDSVLIVILIGVFFRKWPQEKGLIWTIPLILVTIINYSNMVHIFEGIDDAITYHGQVPLHQKNIPNILAVKKVLNKKPLYLSFPSGSKDYFTRHISAEWHVWSIDPQAQQQKLLVDFIDYNTIMPAQYLRLIEEGDLIISAKNIPKPIKTEDHYEILNAQYFYDVHTQKFFDLRQISRHSQDAGAIISEEEKVVLTQKLSSVDRKAGARVVFFVKGAATIEVHLAAKSYRVRQNYGQSYQMFDFVLAQKDIQDTGQVHIEVAPAFDGTLVSIWGPFII